MAVALAGALGCQSVEPSGSTGAELEPAPTLVFHRRAVTPAPGSDQRPGYTLAWEHPDGRLEAIALPRPAVHAVALGPELYWVDADHRLHHRERGHRDEPVAEAVFAAPIAERGLVVFVTGDVGEAQTLHWRDAHGGSGRVPTGLYQLGGLRLAPDGTAVLGVGSTNGGVAGVWVVPLEGDARCLSNCGLRVGEPFGEAFVPSPGAADALVFEGDRVRWDTPAGPVTRRWRQP